MGLGLQTFVIGWGAKMPEISVPLPGTLENAFQLLKMNRTNLFYAGEAEHQAKEMLKNKEAIIINTIDPKELGSNDRAREAKIRELTADMRHKLEETGKKTREAQLAYDLATMSVDLLKWEIRQKESEKA